MAGQLIDFTLVNIADSKIDGDADADRTGQPPAGRLAAIDRAALLEEANIDARKMALTFNLLARRNMMPSFSPFAKTNQRSALRAGRSGANGKAGRP